MSIASHLKELTGRMVKAAGERKDVAKALSTSETMLGRWIDPKHSHFIPLDNLVELDALAGDIFLRDLASIRGFELIPIERKPIIVESVIGAGAEIAKESGTLVHDVYAAEKEGLCPRKEREIRAEMGGLLNAVHALGASLP